jgi:O-glycosyl hydrolase
VAVTALVWSGCLFGAWPGRAAEAATSVAWWSSSEDRAFGLTPQPELAWEPISGQTPWTGKGEGGLVVLVNDDVSHQSMVGLGSSLEHSTCYNLSRLPPARRTEVLQSLLDPKGGIGMSLMRVCIGTPDFTASPWYSYNDLPAGQTDPEQKRFSIERDRAYVLPVLREARRIRPDLKFVASPWSPPAWMKIGGRLTGGAIDPVAFRPFALYLARFVEAYREEGIPIHAITVQNEPEYAPRTYPTCRWTADEQRRFIRDHLGPVFRERGLTTLIWCFDHNFNNPSFPSAILGDAAAAAFVDGTAFHHYEGQPSAMSALSRLFPGKHVYFTEGSVFGASGAGRLISYLRHEARSYNAWVALIDDRRQPNPGPHPCSLTPLVLHHDTLEVEHRPDYFLYGQFMRFIPPGSVRVGSTGGGDERQVALRTPDGNLVLVAVNPATERQSLAVVWRGRGFQATLPAKSASTFRWRP